jgi:hypothetical protein
MPVRIDSEVDSQGIDNAGADLQSQTWQPMERLTRFAGIDLESLNDLCKSACDRFLSLEA